MASKEYWFDLADYDLVIAEAMLSTKRFLYVSFICHQVIEKALKGYWVLNEMQILYIHITYITYFCLLKKVTLPIA